MEEKFENELCNVDSPETSLSLQQTSRVTWHHTGADRDSRSAYTPPPTDTSLQMPGLASPPQNWVGGCMMSTPLVVRPSISPLFCHLVAFSCGRKPSHLMSPLKKTDLLFPDLRINWSVTHPKEDVAGGVKASSVNLSGARRALVLHNDRLVPGQGVGYAVLLCVQDGLCGDKEYLSELDDVKQ
ncbi:hypothetical protein E2C01_013739 [Portunus trituberculatus]|uniref:Uncharacterized protein n=1 Tax=Portunus trituberculatus TaxID=210409 RepID=A0A5B7DH15_PORTR|nr:hypothetical protein [Portunus trituberculatus]